MDPFLILSNITDQWKSGKIHEPENNQIFGWQMFASTLRLHYYKHVLDFLKFVLVDPS